MECINTSCGSIYRSAIYLTPIGDLYKSYTILFKEGKWVGRAPQKEKERAKSQCEFDDYLWATAKIVSLVALGIFTSTVAMHSFIPFFLTTGFFTVVMICYAKCKRPVYMLEGIEC